MSPTARSIMNYIVGLILLPRRLLYWLKVLLIGRDRAFTALSERASRWPGMTGIFLRRALFRRILPQCGQNVIISFGTVLSKPTARLGRNVYIGSYCLFGNVAVGDDCLIADNVCIPSGGRQHGTDRLDIPIREQEGEFRQVRIGTDCWIGSGAIILADVGNHCVVGAGSIVTKPVPDYCCVAGNPAKYIRDRRNNLHAERCQDT